MTALVTGATGLLGGALVRRLADTGTPCRALIRDPRSAGLLPPGVTACVGDLTRPDSLPPAVAGVETIFHCAGRVDVWGPRREFFAVNVTGLQHLLAAARARGVRRFVHVSAGAVHGRTLPEGAREDQPFTDLPHPYIQSKVAAEHVVATARAEGWIETVVLRPVHLHGPGAKIVRAAVARLRAGQRTFIAFPPGGSLPLTGLENLLDALVAAGDNRAPSGRAWFINDGVRGDWNDFVRAVARAFGLRPNPRPIPFRAALALGLGMESLWSLARRRTRPPLSRYAIRMLDVRGSFSIRAAREELGWQPRVTLADSLRAACAFETGPEPARAR